MENFAVVCDSLDFESHQERAHINAFKTISEATEREVFGERIFSYPMKNFASETMIFQDTNPFGESAGKNSNCTFSPFSLLQMPLLPVSTSQYGVCAPSMAKSSTPAQPVLQKTRRSGQCTHTRQDQLSPLLDESYRFNNSTLIGHEVIKSLRPRLKRS